MTHRDAQRLFGAYWDDECTQAEREWLEGHFASCAGCRREYEDLVRVLETMGTMPRHEAAPELLDRTLARIRHVSPAPDRLPERRASWVPVTAAAALLVVGGVFALQWTATLRGPATSGVAMKAETPQTPAPAPTDVPAAAPAAELAAVVSDSLFDHAEDVEFVLDPVTLKRGRATVARELPNGIRTEQAVVSF